MRKNVSHSDDANDLSNQSGAMHELLQKPEGLKPGFMGEGATLETVTPIPYDVVNDLEGGY